MKRIVFTKHAEEMLTVRNIPKNLVNSTLMHPDQSMPTREGKLVYIKHFDGTSLKVIVVKEKTAFIVITLYWIAKKRITG